MQAVRVILIVVTVLLLSASVSSAQQSPKCQPWIGIKSWQVAVHISGSGYEYGLGDWCYRFPSGVRRHSISVVIQPCRSLSLHGQLGMGYRPVSQGSIHINATTFSGGPSGCTVDYSYSRTNIPAGAIGGGLDMDFEKGDLLLGYGVTIGPTGNGDYWDTQNYSGICNPIRETFYESSVLSYDPSCHGYDPSLLGLINGALPGSWCAERVCKSALSIPRLFQLLLR